jgi:hypothetical protein
MVTLFAVLVGVAVGVGLGWLALNGVLALAFRRARTMIRRMNERRQAAREASAERRRAEERRAH